MTQEPFNDTAYEDYTPEDVENSFTLSLRKTSRYVDAYRHLDEEQVVATAVLLQESRRVTDHEDPCEPTEIVKMIRVTDHVEGDTPTIIRAIKDTMRYAGCGHEYDCCGCWSHSVSDVFQLRDDTTKFVVIQHASRNY